jgi:hypothetical protein
MPEISRFYGIVIKMYFRDHPPPHFHAEYVGREIIVDIQSLSVIAGTLPARATRMVLEWAADHQADGDWQATCSRLVASIRCRNSRRNNTAATAHRP